MNVRVQDSDGVSIWEFGSVNGQTVGMTSTKYREDGTLEAIVSALEVALFQAKGELSLSANKSD